MKQTIEKIIVSGKGNSKKEAFAAALSQVQDTILKNTDDVILQIQPIDVNVLAAEEKQWTERFLFFFFPRQRAEYSVTFEVKATCTRIIEEQIEFTIKNENPNGIKIPLINKSV